MDFNYERKGKCTYNYCGRLQHQYTWKRTIHFLFNYKESNYNCYQYVKEYTAKYQTIDLVFSNYPYQNIYQQLIVIGLIKNGLYSN